MSARHRRGQYLQAKRVGCHRPLSCTQPQTKRNKTGNKQFGISPLDGRGPVARRPPRLAAAPHRAAVHSLRRPPYIVPEPSSTRFATAAQTTRPAGTTPHTRASISLCLSRASSKTPPHDTCAGNSVVIMQYSQTPTRPPLGLDTTRHIPYESRRSSAVFVCHIAPRPITCAIHDSRTPYTHNECVLYHDSYGIGKLRLTNSC